MNETANVITATHAETREPMRFEGVSGAINVSIVAFSIVFGVLIVLTVMIYAMRLFAADESKDVKKNDSKPAAPVKAAPVQTAAPVQAVSAAPAAQAVTAGTPQTKIVAAITAAILAATGGSGRIVSIQAQPVTGQGGAPNFGAGAWKTSGRIALVNNRLTRTWR